MARPSDTNLLLEMHQQMAQVHGAVFGEGNTSGLIGKVNNIDKQLAVHIDGGRAEARKIAAFVSVLTTIGMFLVNIFISISTGIPTLGK